MRQPTDPVSALSWWRAALAGELPLIHESEPQPGLYKMRLVRGGPWVPVLIEIDQSIDPETGELITDEKLRAEVDGRPADPYEIWTRCAFHPVTEQEFQYMHDAATWDRRHDPGAPAANPHSKIDHLKTPIPF